MYCLKNSEVYMDKKKIIISILIVIGIILLVSSGTYAFFVSITGGADADAGTGMLGIDYTPPGDLTGELVPSSSRNLGLMTTASASLESSSVPASFNLYITPTSIDNINIPALRWEVEAIRDGGIVNGCSNSGNFDGATVNTKIDMVSGCQLTADVTTFNIYIWLDASLITSPINGVTFNANIGASSVPITGEM